MLRIDLKTFLDFVDMKVSVYSDDLLSDETTLPKTIKNKEKFMFFSILFCIVFTIFLSLCCILKVIDSVYDKKWSIVETIYTLIIPIIQQIVILIFSMSLQK